MSVRVYRFGARMPLDRELVVSQLRAAHDYKNELTAIERARRDAMRALYDTKAIRDAEDLLKQASKSDRKACKAALYTLRRTELEAQRERAKEINALAHELQLGARALTKAFWGTYLDIESQAQQARSAPLYDDDGLSPAGPRFLRWAEPMRGQIGMQLQATKPLTTAGALGCGDTRVRVEMRDKGFATLLIRVGSVGREPVWARVPFKMHRAIPDAALWKWVRVSCEPRSPRDKVEYRETWSIEITVFDPAPRARDLDKGLEGAVAVSFSWDKLSDESIRVASWADTRGGRGEVVVPSRVVSGIRKPDGIRSVRDTLWNHLVVASDDAPGSGQLPAILKASLKAQSQDASMKLRFLFEAAATMHLWRSLFRAHALARRWREEKLTHVAPEAYAMLKAWQDRDMHLYDYEHHARDEALRERRELYRVLGARWARAYKHALISNHRLDREARWGDDSDVRFTAAPDQLRGALKNAFGDDALEVKWDREEKWCERACEAYKAGTAHSEMFVERKEKVTNAWAARKKRKAEPEASRNASDNAVK